MALKIRKLSTTKGYLENAPIEFADGLTCVIGARGTCKSTLVETIRFAFDCEPARVALLQGRREDDERTPPFFGLIKATLAGGTAKCEAFLESENEDVSVERETDADAPRVLRAGIPDPALSLSGAVEIYSQGDLQRIAEQPARRLDLIDRPNRAAIEQKLSRRRDAIARLREIGTKLRQTRATLEQRRADLKSLEGLKEQLEQLQKARPDLGPALETERTAHLERQERLAKAQGLIAKRQELLAYLATVASAEPAFREGAQIKSSKAPGSSALASALTTFADLLATIKVQVEAQAKTDVLSSLEKMKAGFGELDQTYLKLKQSQQEVGEALKAEDRLRQQLAGLERLEAEKKDQEKTERDLVDERNALRKEVRKISDEVYSIRKKEVERLNAGFEEVIALTLTQGTRSPEYRATLDRLMTGSRIRNQNEIAKDIALKIAPPELLDAVESGDNQLLAALLEKDKAIMARLIAHLLDSPALYDLEAVVFEDQLEIAMKVEKGVEKPVQQLSKGQMATALLPLVLRSADHPLIFDQPEDDLDNRYIYNTLVARIRELKQERQLILVTHNANIPVLGEADRVVVMQMDSPTKAGAPITGAVDEVKEHILGLLEGGAEAFKERRKRYGKLVK